VTEVAFTGEQCGQPEIRELQTKQDEIAAQPAHEADLLIECSLVARFRFCSVLGPTGGVTKFEGRKPYFRGS